MIRISAIFLFCLITFFCSSNEILNAEKTDIKSWISDGELHKVSCTAYVDTITSTGRKPVEGLTVAGPSEWLGCTCAIYTDQMSFIGFYEFSDIGYGKETNYGSSNLKQGKNIGTIEAGEWIDMYFDSEEAMNEWGKRDVYIQVIKSDG